MKFLKNRLFIGALCIILAVLIGFFAVPLMVSITNQKVEVFAAKTDIVKGTQIDETMIETIEMFASDIPEGAGLSKEDVIGTFATTDISQKDIIFKGKFGTTFPYKDEALYELPPGKYAIAVTTTSLSSSVAGKIKPGDVVTVFANLSGQEDEDPRATYYPELMYLKVLGVTTGSGQDISAEVNKSALPTEGQEDLPLPSAVTLLCNKDQAQLLSGLENQAKLHFALAARENTALSADYLDRQEELFVSREAPESEEERWEISLNLDDPENPEDPDGLEESDDPEESESSEEESSESAPAPAPAQVAPVYRAPASVASKASSVAPVSSKASSVFTPPFRNPGGLDQPNYPPNATSK